MAKPKTPQREALKKLFDSGAGQQEMLDGLHQQGFKDIQSIGGLKGLLSRMAQDGEIVRGKPKGPQKPEKPKKVKKLEPQRLDTQRLETPKKRKVGYVISEKIARAIDIWRIDHRNKSRSEIVEEALSKWLKEKEKKE